MIHTDVRHVRKYIIKSLLKNLKRVLLPSSATAEELKN